MTTEGADSMESVGRLIWFCLMVWGLFRCLYGIWMSLAARNWRKVSGTIEHHGLAQFENGRSWTYQAVIEYSYCYRGRSFSADRVAFGLLSMSFKGPVQTAYRKAIRQAPAVVVYVNPRQPRMATLLVGLQSFHLTNLVFILFIAVIFFGQLSHG